LQYLNPISGEASGRKQQDRIRALEEKLQASEEKTMRIEGLISMLHGDIK